MFYEDINGVIFVIDGTDVKRLKIVKDQIESMDKALKTKIPVAFLINKQDVEGALSKKDVKDFIDLDKIDTNFIWTIK
jgi:signal recognition particle receptor subunit beta